MAEPGAILAGVKAEDVRAYAARPWEALALGEQEHWIRERAARGPLATFEAAQALWIHMRSVRPDWPTEVERRADLDHHIAVKRALDRAAGVLVAATRR
jgi:hypothetical protein